MSIAQKGRIFSQPVPVSLFLLSSFALAAGFIFFDTREVRFAKIGVTLGSTDAPGAPLAHRPKLFVTEIFLLLTVVLVAVRGKKSFQTIKTGIGNRFLWLCAGLFFLGSARAISDIFADPVLVIRNSCFVWYLSIPFLIYLLRPHLELMEKWAFGIFILGLIAFWTPVLAAIPQREITLNWVPFLGLYPCFHIFFSTSRRLALFSCLSLGLGFGWGLVLGLQRTNLLGAILLLPLLYFVVGNFRLFLRKIGLLFLSILAHYAVASVLLTHGWHIDEKVNTRMWRGASFSSPLEKSSGNEAGLEHFRMQLWNDSWKKFTERPFLGIGFREQVVYRIFHFIDGDGNIIWIPNDGKSIGGREPISGPHNSYLNALARLGILGLGFVCLHGCALWVLWKQKFYYLFYLVYAGAIYAIFNVGLEGPVRSFNLLMGLGAAAMAWNHEPSSQSSLEPQNPK